MTPLLKNKTDRRIQRTCKALRTALLELIKEKGYDAISIEDITERANVGRATFYLHYKDKEDLLLEEFSEMANEKVQVLTEIPFSNWLQSQEEAGGKAKRPDPPLLIVFEHIYDNSELYYILLKSEKSSRIVERIRKISTEAIVKFVEAKAKTDPLQFNVPIEFFAAFFSGALLSTVDWWLEEEMRHTPREMTHLFQSLFFKGAKNAIGITDMTCN
jgi:AcrR family transcriptional regulator